jgi:hypothetical protein
VDLNSDSCRKMLTDSELFLGILLVLTFELNYLKDSAGFCQNQENHRRSRILD